MKKIFLVTIMMALVALTSYAGGILTNTNQSAQFVRMLSRNASTQLDAVYFNPAGVLKLENGFHLGLHNQSIFQTRTITSKFPYLNDGAYEGKISAPVFPDVYAAWKKDKFSLSFMLGPVGGGGGAKYDRGLPSFETQIASIPASLTANGIPTTKYSTDIFFEGTSVFWGFQLNAGYAINEVISVSAGARILMANNTYNGYLKDISINPNQTAFGAAYNGSTLVPAPKFFSDAATTLSGWATGATSYVTGLQPIITGGGGTVLLSNGTAAGLSAAQITQIQGLLGAAGLTPAQIGAINIQTAQGTLNSAAPVFAGKAAAMSANATGTANKEVDTRQTGKGYTPIFGLNITPSEDLNIGLKYEHRTVLKLTNETTTDQTGLFPDGQESNSDLPAIFTAGIDYKFSNAFSSQLSFTNFFDKGVDWGKNVYKQVRTIDNNSWELALGFQYNVTENFLVSIGGMQSTTGVSEQYQSDFSFSNTSNTGGLGFQWKLNKALTVDAGMLYTVYKDAVKDFSVPFPMAYQETYDKKNIGFAIGIGYKIF